MLLKVSAVSSKEAGVITVKRPPEVRNDWVTFYDGGKRLCRLSLKDGCCHALLKKRPEVKGGSITFEFGLFLVAEVWGGMDNELCSVFVSLDGVVYHGHSINGWKFRRTPAPIKFPMVNPSWQAELVALRFLEKDCDALTTTDTETHERLQSNNHQAIDARPAEGTDNAVGPAETPSLLL